MTLSLLGAGAAFVAAGGTSLSIATSGSNLNSRPAGANTDTMTASIGTASTVRTVAIEIAVLVGSGSPFTLTLGGQAMTVRTTNSGVAQRALVATLDIDSGNPLYASTTASLVATTTGFSLSWWAIQSYVITGAVPATYTPATPINYFTANATVTFTVPAGGIGMAAAYGDNQPAATTVTGATKDSESATNVQAATLVATHTTTTGAQSVNFSNTGNGFSVVGLAVS